jgi:hypothetical protein
MSRALTKLLPEDHPSIEKRSCKRRDNNERPKYQNVRVSFSSAAFFFDSVLAVGPAAHCRSGRRVPSFVTMFSGIGGATKSRLNDVADIRGVRSTVRAKDVNLRFGLCSTDVKVRLNMVEQNNGENRFIAERLVNASPALAN